ncbi:transforming growth factor-beta-induced protein ig-h3-like [Mercenaria mercenaria]|uniref:transforming growth factor-beta-induced protein ig-h3-like n=1 Tax=Mercenaria mercenaria TaxID=6596 RepID=UPI00234EFFE8|nr:transforming growth factor-beta-induced protein ig-h3-like [Mercenaria mercenaria]
MKVLGIIYLCIASVVCQTTVERLVADGRFTTLVSYVTKAGLVGTLNNGTFTIFAPTDAAFNKLDAATKTALENDNSLLKDALLYHVISGNVPSSAASNELKITMANGKDARINIYSHSGNNVVTIQGNVISQFDLNASNGIIHVIDSVMLAPTGDIVDYVSGNSELSTLLSLVVQANLTTALKGDALTLFAPSNAAFAKLSQAQVNDITGNAAKLAAVLTYHVVGSTQYSAGLYQKEHLSPLNSNDDLVIHFTHHHTDVKVENALVTSPDIGVANGVVHIVDHVLIPHADPIVG